jgi:hypothetical protein
MPNTDSALAYQFILLTLVFGCLFVRTRLAIRHSRKTGQRATNAYFRQLHEQGQSAGTIYLSCTYGAAVMTGAFILSLLFGS